MNMKQIFVTLLILFITGFNLAKADDVSFIYLLGTDSVNVNLDFTRLKTPKNVNVSIAELLERNGEVWRINFLNEMNMSNEEWNLKFGTYNSRYTILVQFISVESNASLRAIFRIIDMHMISEVYAQVAECRGGLYGDFEELIGESIQRMGEEIGDIIKDNMD